MQELQTEIQNSVRPKQMAITITTGSTYTVTSSGIIRSVHLHMPKRGPNANEYNSYCRYSLDSGTTWSTLERRSTLSIDGTPEGDLKFISGSTQTKLEIILLEEF